MKADSSQPTAYRRLVRFVIFLGTITFVSGCFWLWLGAGIYGSPVAGAFEVDKLTGYSNYYQFWILWVAVAGPIALLPCALLERFLPPVGALAMIIASLFVAEAGIRASRMYWGFSTADAQIVIGCISIPMMLLAASLLMLRARRIRWQTVIVALFAMILLVVGLSVRYMEVKDYWNANCPQKLPSL